MKKIVLTILAIILVAHCACNAKIKNKVEYPNDILIGVCDKKHRCGYVNLKNEVVVPFKYRFVNHKINEQGYSIVSRLDDGLYGVIDKKGNIIVDFKYDIIGKYYDDRASVLKGEKRGYVDKTGKLVIPLQYKVASDFREGLAKVSYDKKLYGAIDVNGKTVIPFEFERMSYCIDGLVEVTKNGKSGFYDRAGKQITPFIYNRTRTLKNGNILVEVNKKIGIIDKNGKYVLEPKYEHYDVFYNIKPDLQLCLKDNKGVLNCGAFSKDGKQVIPLKYKRVVSLGDGLFEVTHHNGKVEYIHPKGELEFMDKPHDYTKFDRYEDGYVVAKKKDEAYGLLDKNGNVIVPFNYYHFWHFNDDIIRVEKAHRPAFYNKKGENIVPLGKYMFASDFNNGRAIVSKEYALSLGDGLIDKTGKVIFQSKNSEVEEITKGFYGVNSRSSNWSAVYDADGNVVIPHGKYSRIELHN